MCNRVKVNGSAFRGSNSAIFILASIFNVGQLIKERICSTRSKFFPLRVDLIFKRLQPPGWKQKVGNKICFLCKNYRKKHGGALIHLNHSLGVKMLILKLYQEKRYLKTQANN